MASDLHEHCKGSHLDGTMLLRRLLVLSVLILPDMKINYVDKHHNHINMLENHKCIGDYHFCLLGFSSHLRIVHSSGEVTFAGIGLQILTMLGTMRGWDSNTQPSAWEADALTHCATHSGQIIM